MGTADNLELVELEAEYSARMFLPQKEQNTGIPVLKQSNPYKDSVMDPEYRDHTGLLNALNHDGRKPVFRVSDQVIPKTACPATETYLDN